MQRSHRTALGLTLVALLVGLYQNCGDGGFVAKSSKTVLSSVAPIGTGTPAPTATPTPPLLPSIANWNEPFPALKLVADCLTNDAYNLCLPYKDPVTTNNGAFSPALAPSNSTAAIESKIFLYGMKVPTSGALENDNFKIVTTGFSVATPVNGSWKFNYRGDSAHRMAQMSAWYTVNRARSFVMERAGGFHFSAAAAGSKLSVRPYRTGTDFADNAYFDTTDMSLNLGYITAGVGDIALDQPVVAHELGHANFFSANEDSLDDRLAVACFSNRAECCPTLNGCSYAIHEGQADVLAMFMFPDKGGTLGAYWRNSLQGEAPRNLDLVESNSRTANYFYTLHSDGTRSGEIHDMGTIYASLWYGVWKRSKALGIEQTIETLFNEHLVGLGGNDTFITAFTTIGSMADARFPAQAAAIRTLFRAEYTRLGLTVP